MMHHNAYVTQTRPHSSRNGYTAKNERYKRFNSGMKIYKYTSCRVKFFKLNTLHFFRSIQLRELTSRLTKIGHQRLCFTRHKSYFTKVKNDTYR
jgi:hypothetical protein